MVGRFAHEDILCKEDCKQVFPCGHKCREICGNACSCACKQSLEPDQSVQGIEDDVPSLEEVLEDRPSATAQRPPHGSSHVSQRSSQDGGRRHPSEAWKHWDARKFDKKAENERRSRSPSKVPEESRGPTFLETHIQVKRLTHCFQIVASIPLHQPLTICLNFKLEVLMMDL